MSFHIFAQSTAEESLVSGIMGMVILFYLAVLVITFVSYWKVFAKAGRPGWEGIVPIYNYYILITQIIKKPTSWAIAYLVLIVVSMIPFVGLLAIIPLLVLSVLVMHELSKAFGQGVGFTIGLVLLPIIFLPVLAFGDYKYVLGNSAAGPIPAGVGTTAMASPATATQPQQTNSTVTDRPAETNPETPEQQPPSSPTI